MRAQYQILIRCVMAAGLLISGALFSVLPAATDDGKACTDSLKSDAAIAACTRAIVSGQYTSRNIATFYTSRALAYSAKSQVDRAIQDFDDAIRLDPQFAQGDETDPVSVGDGLFIVCCRAVVLDCRVKASWRLRDDMSENAKRCVETCWRKLTKLRC